MYHCHVHFYLIGRGDGIFRVIKGMEPLLPITHEFWESDELDMALAARADVILADVRDKDVGEALHPFYNL